MNGPKVSIIVPVYNVDEYVGKCIDSIVNQTYKNLEILINNDGSTDNSYEICMKYAEKDNRIHLYTQDNAGAAACRNKMIEIATGDYILFVDSDDWILPEHVERLVTLLEKYNADAASCGFKEVRRDIEFSTANKKWKVLKYTGKEFVYEMTRLTGYRCVPWGRLIKKEFFKGFSFPVGRRMEDLYAMPGLMVKLNSIIYTNEPLYMYRYRAASDIHSPFKISRTDELDGYINLTRTGFVNDIKPIIRNGALFFVLNYIRFRILMRFKGIGPDAYIAKYLPYQKMYLRYLMTGKICNRDLLFKELIPLR